MPQQLPELSAELRKKGVQLDPARLADLTGDPLGAVINLGHCTAAFVSPDGLIVTNYHCAFSSIQHNSSPERDLINSGFLAKTRKEELPAAPGTRVWVTTKLEDVTARMNEGLETISADSGRARILERREKELVAECERAGGVRCKVASFFEGSLYQRVAQKELTDVRLAYAPARGIGEFGGEIDNFEWPRHTGDFAFYRAYAGGKPYKPKQWLKVAKEGVEEGDVVLVAGYPARTYRHKTADEVRRARDFTYPVNVRYMSETVRLLEEAGKDREAQIRNAARIRSLANSLKYYTAVSEGFVKDRIVEIRLARERAIRDQPELAAFHPALDQIAARNAELSATRERDLVLEWLIGTPWAAKASPMLTQAYLLTRLAVEQPRADAERAPNFQDRDVLRLKQLSERAQKAIDPGSDRAVLRYFLVEASRLPKEQRIAAVDDAIAAAGSIDKLLDRLYANTRIASFDERLKMFGETRSQLAARNDAMLDLAAALVPLAQANEERELGYRGAMSRLRPLYFEALRDAFGRSVYPDANGTLRITFGNVEGYRPKDATYFGPRTTLRGLVEKERGKEPFANPKTLLAAAADPAKTRPYADAKLGDVPVNFLTTCDTTGGNSGSPTLNAKGELVGLLFDGNYESIDADYLYTPESTRSIHVDIRYVLWVMDMVDGADGLLGELGVVAAD